MSDEPPASRHVAFAERFASGPVNRFTAFAALERARLLQRETQTIAEIFKREDEQEEPAAWSWHGLEVVPYTLVGLATCLEWHARSRLTDIYSFKPDSIDPKVLEGKVHPRVLSEMIKAKVSIPQLLGASITVGSVTEYLAVFTNVFKVLGIPLKPEKVIQPPVVEQVGLFGEPIREPLVREKIDELFSTRHALVHEIGHNRGHGRTLCEIWSAEHILRTAHTVIATITELERTLTERAPKDFPNLLTDQGYPVDVRGRLSRAIEELETEIGREIALRQDGATEAWATALEKARSSVAAYDDLFADRKLFEERHWASAHLLLTVTLEQRLALLTEIAAALAKSATARPT